MLERYFFSDRIECNFLFLNQIIRTCTSRFYLNFELKSVDCDIISSEVSLIPKVIHPLSAETSEANAFLRYKEAFHKTKIYFTALIFLNNPGKL